MAVWRWNFHGYNQIKTLSILLSRWIPDDYEGRMIAGFYLFVDTSVAVGLSLHVAGIFLLEVYKLGLAGFKCEISSRKGILSLEVEGKKKPH